MIEFEQASQAPCDPTGASWNYPNCKCGEYPCRFPHDIVEVTCPFGHQSRMVDTIHKVLDNGMVDPSYVCPRDGCIFHEYVKLAGWTGRKYNKHD